MKRNEVLARGTAVLICLAAAAGLGACGKKGNLKESVVASLAAEETPDTQIHEGIKLDFDEAQSSTEELVDDYADEYPLNDYIDTYVDEERKIVNLIWPLKNEATEKDGVRTSYFIDLGDFCYGYPMFDIGMVYLCCCLNDEDWTMEVNHMSNATAARFWDAFALEYFGPEADMEAVMREVKIYAGLKTIIVERDTHRPMPQFRAMLEGTVY